MANPWEKIKLDDYEKHMSLDSVKQLQILNSIMKRQFDEYPVDNAMVLGVAGGNGLEHISKAKYRKVFGIDINKEYLDTVLDRYSYISDVLECLKIDLINEYERLPISQLVIANLLIEYIGYDSFEKVIDQVKAKYVSCVIQINTNEEKWVSDSPYIHAFDGLNKVHCHMEEVTLSDTMEKLGYQKTLKELEPLPDGKALLRLDYRYGEVNG